MDETINEHAFEQPVQQRSELSGEDARVLQDYYHQMLLIRRFEERAGEMYTRAKIGGYCHLNLGEEATIVGVMAALAPEDYMFTNYREHGYAIARGVAPGRVMAELFGKETGVSRGRGGSMHLFDADTHFMGGYAIVGGQIPLATGAAYALKYQERPGIVLCQMGDATTNIGAWHESLNLAKVLQLPIVFLIVNNGYGMGTTVEEGSAEPDLYKRGCAYRIHGERVDGRDVLMVRDAVRRLRQRAQAAGEPAILEAISFRFRGHSIIDADRYRDPEEVKRGRSADPVSRFARQLVDANLVDDTWLKDTAHRVDRAVQEAIDFADTSPEPPLDDLCTGIYATPVPNAPGAAEARALEADLLGDREPCRG